jgi:hypothetical protein
MTSGQNRPYATLSGVWTQPEQAVATTNYHRSARHALAISCPQAMFGNYGGSHNRHQRQRVACAVVERQPPPVPDVSLGFVLRDPVAHGWR